MLQMDLFAANILCILDDFLVSKWDNEEELERLHMLANGHGKGVQQTSPDRHSPTTWTFTYVCHAAMDTGYLALHLPVAPL